MSKFQIKLLSHLYRVVFTKSALTDPVGTTSIADDTIRVRDDVPVELQRTTLLHEVIHLISDHLHLELTEAQISGLSCGMKGVLIDNRTFVDWLLNRSPRRRRRKHTRAGRQG